jgi:hypothetical protein
LSKADKDASGRAAKVEIANADAASSVSVSECDRHDQRLTIRQPAGYG